MRVSVLLTEGDARMYVAIGRYHISTTWVVTYRHGPLVHLQNCYLGNDCVSRRVIVGPTIDLDGTKMLVYEIQTGRCSGCNKNTCASLLCNLAMVGR